MKTESVEIQKEVFSERKSAAQKYSELVVGRPGFWALLKYELIIMLCRNTPGAWGMLLRGKLYPRLLKKCGRNVFFGCQVVLRHPHKIELGDNVVVDDNCLLDAKGRDNEGIRVGNGVFIGRNTILSCKNGDIVLEDGVNLGFNCEVFSGSRVVLGRNTLVAAYTYFIGGDHDYRETGKSVLEQGRCSRGIQIGEGCWFGAGVKVLDGVEIGEHSIVGAGAVVTKSIPARKIAVGIPARVVKDREQDSFDDKVDVRPRAW